MLFKDRIFSTFQDIEIFCTDRWWGNSSWNYSSFNLWIKSWDIIDNVIKNRQGLADNYWINVWEFIYLNQVHGSDICILKEGEEYNKEWYDALITNRQDIVPMTLAADCVPVIIYDPIKKVIWAIHSGWRGTSQNIVGKTITLMNKEFWSLVGGIGIIIWPCISQKNYEVDEKVIAHFSDIFYEMKKSCLVVPY